MPIPVPENDPYLALTCVNQQNASAATGQSGEQLYCKPGVSTAKCISFTRSSASPTFLNCTSSRLSFEKFKCLVQVLKICILKKAHRETLNLLSSYIDGSVIYGNSEAKCLSLRTLYGGAYLTVFKTLY